MERPGATNEGYGIKTFQFSRRYKLKLDWTIVAPARNAIFKWPACYFSTVLFWLPCRLLGEAFFDCLPEREPPSSLPYSILAVYLFHIRIYLPVCFLFWALSKTYHSLKERPLDQRSSVPSGIPGT